MKALQCENDALRLQNGVLGEDVVSRQVDRMEAESQSTGRPLHGDEEAKKMHNDLWSLMDKYEEMDEK